MTDPVIDFRDEDEGLWRRAFEILKRRGDVAPDVVHPVDAVEGGGTPPALLHFTIARFKDWQLEAPTQVPQPGDAQRTSLLHKLNVEAADKARAARLVAMRVHGQLARVQKLMAAAVEHGSASRDAVNGAIKETERRVGGPFPSLFLPDQHPIFRALNRLQEAEAAIAAAVVDLTPLGRDRLPRDRFPSLQGMLSKQRKAEINKQIAWLAKTGISFDELAEIFEVRGLTPQHKRDAVGDRVSRGLEALILLGEWDDGSGGDESA